MVEPEFIRVYVHRQLWHKWQRIIKIRPKQSEHKGQVEHNYSVLAVNRNV